MVSNARDVIDRLKADLDKLRPLKTDVLASIEQKLRFESNYHSNAIEGNTLTLGETRNLILHGLTARGKPMRDHLDINGHDSAVKSVEDAISNKYELTEVFIRNLHRILLKEPYRVEAIDQDGRPVTRTISIGDYKTSPNNVRTSTGETYYFTPPEQVKPAMSDLIDWYRAQEGHAEHPIIIAATFHYRFVRIHPFDDGNGRIARLLMNMILIKHGYTVALIRQEDRDQYLRQLEQADKTENLSEFIDYIANCCEYSLNLHLKAARGEPIEDFADIDREITLFKQSLMNAANETVSARKYIESVLNPFQDYCQSRIRLFSDVFGNERTLISLFATTMEGQVVTVCEDSQGLPPLPDKSVIPEQVRSVSFKSSAYLTNFQGHQKHVLIEVKNNVNAQGNWWMFSIMTQNIHLEYDGHDLDELRKRFNEILRTMMRNLK